MKKSRVCALGLACFLSAVTAFSALAATSGGGALLRNLSDNSAHSGASLSGQNATENLSAEEEKIAAEMQADLFAGTLELDPENDPVIATTDWGLEIKLHNAGEYQGAGYLVANPSTNGTTTLGSTSYAYVTMGTYNNTAVNWVIIGYSTNAASGTSVVKATNLNIPDTTDAGNALKSSSSKGILISTQYLLNAYTNAVPSGEIPGGCVLVLSAGNLFTTYYNRDTSAKEYSGSNLQTEISALYSSGLGLTSAQKDKIQAQSLNSYSKLTASYVSISGQKLFPLGCDDESFDIENYLNAKTRALDDSQWLRYPGRYVAGGTSGNIGAGLGLNRSSGVRPAFVLKL